MKFSHLSRIYTTKSLAENQLVTIDGDDYHYLKTVMRLRIGEEFRLFNAADGEYLVKVAAINRSNLEVKLELLLRAPEHEKQLVLAMSLIKPDRMMEAIKGAVQIGATQIMPIITERSQYKKIARDRIERSIIQATEQSERFVPAELLPEISLPDFLKANQSVQIIAACESEDSSKKIANINKIENKIIILIGPEGGFSDAEMASFKSLDNIYSVSLGKSVLRSETAAIATLACVAMLRD
jgi:16S rRNA (uracil1498-N3)-methyltransferase